MKKIVINLHPKAEKQDNRILDKITKYMPFIILGLIVIIAVDVLLFTVTSSQNLAQKNMKKKLTELKPKSDEVAALKQELESLSQQKQEYRNLITSNISLSHILADIFDSMPNNIWLKYITYEEKSISFTGYVVKLGEETMTSLNDKFIQNLGKAKYFSGIFKDISLQNSKKETIVNTELLSFRIECTK